MTEFASGASLDIKLSFLLLRFLCRIKKIKVLAGTAVGLLGADPARGLPPFLTFYLPTRGQSARDSPLPLSKKTCYITQIVHKHQEQQA